MKRRTRTIDLCLLRFELLDKMDDNGDGVLSVEEFTNGLEELGIDCTSDELNAVMRYFDEDRNGTIDAIELEQIIKKHTVTKESLAAFGGEEAKRLNRCIQAAEVPLNLRTIADSRYIVEHIKDIPFFKNYTENQTLQICRSLTKVTFSLGEYIFREGEEACMLPPPSTQSHIYRDESSCLKVTFTSSLLARSL
jgi:hypothetical protein